ncbi:MAG: cohesin domain-containing protein [Candidatus Zixiibacteriota bacterium]
MFSFKPKSITGQICVIVFLLILIPPVQAQLRGDINQNHIPYEVADLVQFDLFLLYGDSILVDPLHQGVSSDVNGDMVCWSIGDLIHLGRVYSHDATPIIGSVDISNAQVNFDIGFDRASSGDTVSLPLTYFTWGTWQTIYGLDFRIAYDPAKLTLLGVDLTGGRLADWNAVYYHIKPGQLRFSARPENLTTSLSDSLPIAYPDTALLAMLNFVVTTTDTPSFVPIYFEADTVPCYQLLPLTFACIESSVTQTGGWNSYANGGIQIGSTPQRGDINLNSLPYEVADIVLFDAYLTYGDTVLTIDPEQQSMNSDVNWDFWQWSMADFIHLGRVIIHDAPEMLEPITLSQHHFDMWMTTLHALPHDTVSFPVWYGDEGNYPAYGISFKISYDPNDLNLLKVDFSGTPLENWEVVHVRSENGSVIVNACPEYTTTSLSDPLLPPSYPQIIAQLEFVVTDVDTPAYLPVSFDVDTASQLQPTAFATIEGTLTKLGIPDLRNGGIQVGGELACKSGDVNFNTITYEIADWVLFENFLVNGLGVLIYDPEAQTCASDVNCDYIYWTISDLLYMSRVILHDAPEIPCKYQEFALPQPILSPPENQDKLILVSSSAHPGETVSVPMWLSNILDASGVTLKVVFDSTSLSVEGVDTFQTRIEGWQNIVPVINPGELFFFGYPDWWYTHPFSYIPPGEGILLRINFKIADNVSPGISLPITFETESNLGHYNAYTDTSGLILVQPSTISGWIYTDVITGDTNSDGILDVGDLVYLLNYLYRAGIPPSPISLGDFNNDSEVNVSDVVALINYLFHS